MSAPEQVIDGTAEEVDGTGRELVHAPPPSLSVAPQVGAAELVSRLDAIKQAADQAMEKDVDYGRVPGTDKPTLFKPGAEKLAVLFQLDVQITHEERWGPGDHLTVPARATVFHAPTGSRLGSGEGMCSTRERKYAYRKQERTCPTCGKQAIIKGKKEYGGGWVCWKKRDGCDAKFKDGDQAIEGQVVGEIENPDLPDLWNTCIKMARKRALVDAVLLVTGASALFTQDVEEMARDAEPVQEQPAAQPQASANGKQPKPLTDAQRRKVIDAIEAAGQSLHLVLAAVGLDSTDDLTDVAAHEIKSLLDRASA